MKKLFVHDCNRCTYLGGHRTDSGGHADMYVCINKRDPRLSSLIYRTGNDGPDYRSMDIGTMKSLIDSNQLIRPSYLEVVYTAAISQLPTLLEDLNAYRTTSQR